MPQQTEKDIENIKAMQENAEDVNICMSAQRVRKAKK